MVEELERFLRLILLKKWGEKGHTIFAGSVSQIPNFVWVFVGVRGVELDRKLYGNGGERERGN